MNKIPNTKKKMIKFLSDVAHTDETDLNHFGPMIVKLRDVYVEDAIEDFCKKNDYRVDDFREKIIEIEDEVDKPVSCEDLLKGFYADIALKAFKADELDRRQPLIWTFEITADSKAIHENICKIESEEDKK